MKLKQTNQEQNTFNSLRINIIKVTFFDGKDAIFVIKDATCKKCEKEGNKKNHNCIECNINFVSIIILMK